MQAVSQSDRRMDEYYVVATNENITQTLHKTLGILRNCVSAGRICAYAVLDIIDSGLAKS